MGKGFKINGEVWFDAERVEIKHLIFPSETCGYKVELRSDSPIDDNITRVKDLSTGIVYTVESLTVWPKIKDYRVTLFVHEETKEECQERTYRYVLTDRGKVLGIYKDTDSLNFDKEIHEYMVEVDDGYGAFRSRVTAVWKDCEDGPLKSDYWGAVCE